MLKSLWNYRGFINAAIQRDFQSRYQNSLLGILWAILGPLAMILVYTLVFSQVMKAKLPGVEDDFSYGIYLCSGIIVWGLFSEITTKSLNVFIENANLIKKSKFPKICLPLIVVFNASINFIIILVLFTSVLLLSGRFPGWVYWGILPLFVIQVIFSMGLGIILGILNVFFRDVGHFFAIILQFWFWLTPIVYISNVFQGPVKYLLDINPLTALLEAYHDVLVFGKWPNWQSLLLVTLCGIAFNLIGLKLYRRVRGDMVDEL